MIGFYAVLGAKSVERYLNLTLSSKNIAKEVKVIANSR
jgi:hypothetical protein